MIKNDPYYGIKSPFAVNSCFAKEKKVKIVDDNEYNT